MDQIEYGIFQIRVSGQAGLAPAQDGERPEAVARAQGQEDAAEGQGIKRHGQSAGVLFSRKKLSLIFGFKI